MPTAKKRSFHSVGRNKPKVNDDVAEEVTLTERAHRAGRLVAFLGYATLLGPSPNVPLLEIGTAYSVLAFLGSILSKADAVHSKANVLMAWKPRDNTICGIFMLP